MKTKVIDEKERIQLSILRKTAKIKEALQVIQSRIRNLIGD